MNYVSDYVAAKSSAVATTAADALSKTTATAQDSWTEFTKHPEKARAVLNLLFAPRFQPTFVDDESRDDGYLGDAELLRPSVAKPTRYPFRMFDLETENLVEYPEIGVLGQYCILSHSWKGNEVDYSYILKARDLDLTNLEAPNKKSARPSDVWLIKEKCRQDIAKQAETIRKGAEDVVGEIGLAPTDEDLIMKLLVRRTKARWAADELTCATKEMAKAKSKLKLQEMENKIFKGVARDMEQQVFEPYSQGDAAGVQSPAQVQQPASLDEVPVEGGGEADKARRAEAAIAALGADISFFQKHVLVQEAVDGMISCLQRWKSTVKIEQSIKRARQIFDTKSFSPSTKRYIWNDTCCINKTNPSEYVESLSIMGDWYAHAEFCLVNLDTRRLPQFCETHQDGRCTVECCPIYLDRKRSAEEWLDEWRILEKKATREANIKSFREVHCYTPEWAERGWTLQELILSKTTFYVNSVWEPLSRPVENLGRYYYVCPFIELYCYGAGVRTAADSATVAGFLNIETLNNILPSRLKDKGADQEGNSEAETTPEAGETEDIKRIQIALKLIAILEDLGVHISHAVDNENAVPLVSQAVYLAAIDLGGKDGNRRLLEAVEGGLGRQYSKDKPVDVARATQVINFLLQCLVAETRHLIVKDRKYIASFSNVQGLSGWEEGTTRTSFPADKVMTLACKRKCTVKTDSAYSLMGLVQVRFPTYSAEGLPKALSRLLDEVIITSNDVSVFNWSGISRGSSVRGRSLYPSSLKAYAPERNKNKQLAQEVQVKMRDVMVAYQNVFRMLREAIDFIKSREKTHLPIAWVQGILEFVQKAQYASLHTELRNIAKILAFIQQRCGVPIATNAASGQAPAAQKESASGSGFMSNMTRPSLPSVSSLSGGIMSIPKIPGRKSFGARFGREAASPKTSPSSSTAEVSMPASSISEAAATANAEQPESTLEQSTPEKVWEPLHEHVMGYIDSITPREDQERVDDEEEEDDTAERGQTNEGRSAEAESAKSPGPKGPGHLKRTPSTLPQQVQDVFATIKGLELPDAVEEAPAAQVISPNPIMVTTSGIEGIFDIQRVVVTFRDIHSLRARVRRAVFPQQKISAWCTLSTGFAMVTVKFACEKHILEKQLDVVQTVDRAIGRGEQGEEDEAQGARHDPVWVKRVNSTLLRGKSDAPKNKQQADRATEGEGDDEAEGLDIGTADADTKHSPSEVKAALLLQHIQEPSLDRIAGEWVLARFSGCASGGAHWFLVALSLGAAPGTLHGVRIAADAIDFAEGAAPEPGLLSVWRTYMARKKRKLCRVLKLYVDSKESSREGAAVAAQARRAYEAGFGGSPKTGTDGQEGAGLEEGLLDQVLAKGKMAASLVEKYTAAAVLEKFFELRADHFDKTLGASVLKRTPKALQAAVEGLNDNLDLLPAMFHSSVRVHMF